METSVLWIKLCRLRLVEFSVSDVYDNVQIVDYVWGNCKDRFRFDWCSRPNHIRAWWGRKHTWATQPRTYQSKSVRWVRACTSMPTVGEVSQEACWNQEENRRLPFCPHFLTSPQGNEHMLKPLLASLLEANGELVRTSGPCLWAERDQSVSIARSCVKAKPSHKCWA